MIFPKSIKPGDTIGVICPSSPVSKERAEKVKEKLESMGYKVKYGESVYSSEHGYLAGNSELRANDINKMFADQQIHGIICMRGGNGSCRIMGMLDAQIVKNNPKVFVGYSDITSLHVFFNQEANLVTFHGPMASSNMLNNYDNFTKESFENVINMTDEYTLKNPDKVAIEILKDGYAKGTIIGGNLALICSAIGTHYEADFKDKLLFIEDVGESIERVDRMMWHLKHSKKLDQVSGIIIGDFADCANENDPSYDVKALMIDVLSDVNVPIMYNIKSGHCFPMSTIPMGAKCSMDTSKKEIKFYK